MSKKKYLPFVKWKILFFINRHYSFSRKVQFYLPLCSINGSSIVNRQHRTDSLYRAKRRSRLLHCFGRASCSATPQHTKSKKARFPSAESAHHLSVQKVPPRKTRRSCSSHGSAPGTKSPAQWALEYGHLWLLSFRTDFLHAWTGLSG